MLVAGRLSSFIYGGSMALAIRAHDQSLAGSELGSEVIFNASAGVKVADDKLVLGPEIFGSTVISSDAAFKTRNTPFEGILGGHYTFLDDFRIGTGVGAGLTRGFGSPVARWVVSLSWVPAYQEAPKDRDHDGVLDPVDACPDTPKGAKVDAKGCPSDSDGDGVLDGLDQCPDTPKGAKVDPKGCPLDGDKDGVFDGLDACPDTKPGVKVVIDGHTDSSGGAAHNLKLSADRAESVKAYLVSKGIDAGRMSTKGYGETQPIADNKTKEGKAKNRRVDLAKVD